jgi:uncharacterized membrane protein
VIVLLFPFVLVFLFDTLDYSICVYALFFVMLSMVSYDRSASFASLSRTHKHKHKQTHTHTHTHTHLGHVISAVERRWC